MAGSTTSTVELVKEGDNDYSFNTTSTFRSQAIKFQPGVEFTEKRMDGQEIPCVITFYGNKMIQEQKGDKIDELAAKIDQQNMKLDDQSSQMNEQAERIERLLAFSEKAAGDNAALRDELSEVHEDLRDTKKTVTVVAKHLVKKSFASTKDPENEGLRHHALVVVKNISNGYMFKFSSGQSDYIDECKQELLSQGYEVHTDKFYQANGVDYRRNVQYTVQTYIDEKLEHLNQPINLLREELNFEF